MQKWLRYDAARNHLECYEREGEAFLRRIITLDETWAFVIYMLCYLLLYTCVLFG
jgi:hypothetical protein